MKKTMTTFLSILLAFMMVLPVSITSTAAGIEPNMVDAAYMLEDRRFTRF